MTEHSIKGIITVALASAAIYLEQIGGAIAVLIGVMTLDYLTGMLKAYLTSSLSSKKGLRGILKKLGYLAVVAAGVVCDWVIGSAMTRVGISYAAPSLAALLVTVWLIVNELISILENLQAIQVPMPAFLTKLLRRLAVRVEEKGDENSVTDAASGEQQPHYTPTEGKDGHSNDSN